MPQQSSCDLIDISISRNAYGSQLDSFVGGGQTQAGRALEMVFIRAPKIQNLSQDVDVVATYQNYPVWVKQDNVMITTFHPELSLDSYVHECFLKMTAR